MFRRIFCRFPVTTTAASRTFIGKKESLQVPETMLATIPSPLAGGIIRLLGFKQVLNQNQMMFGKTICSSQTLGNSICFPASSSSSFIGNSIKEVRIMNLFGGKSICSSLRFGNSIRFPASSWSTSLINLFGGKSLGFFRSYSRRGKNNSSINHKGCKNIRPKPKTRKLRLRRRAYRCYLCEERPIYFTRDEMMKHNFRHATNQFPCSHCLSRFPTKARRDAHSKSRICYHDLDKSNLWDEKGRVLKKLEYKQNGKWILKSSKHN